MDTQQQNLLAAAFGKPPPRRVELVVGLGRRPLQQFELVDEITSIFGPRRKALPRTIPEEALDFEMRMYVHAGRKLPVPEAHMISEYKVKLRVKVEDLGLDDLGEARLAYLTGPRFDAARGVLTLTAERFPSRTENRRYLIHQLELLKRAASEADDEFDAAWRRLKEGE